MKAVGIVELKNKQWQVSQREYIAWANTPLPNSYIFHIIRLGIKFHKFIGNQGFCLDVGCGNGLIGGKTYKDLGYAYLDPNRSSIGIDPLPLRTAKQRWLKEYIRGIGEYLSFQDEVFDTVVFATTLDHVQNINECLMESKRVLKPNGSLNIWLTLPNRIRGKDPKHPHRLKAKTLKHLLRSAGFKIIKEFVEPFLGSFRICDVRYIVSTGNTTFIKAVKKR